MCPWSIPGGGAFFVAHTGSASCSLVTRGNLREATPHGPPLRLFISVVTVWMIDNPAGQLENIRQALQVEPSFGVGFGWSLRSPLMSWLLWPQQICEAGDGLWPSGEMASPKGWSAAAGLCLSNLGFSFLPLQRLVLIPSCLSVTGNKFLSFE